MIQPTKPKTNISKALVNRFLTLLFGLIFLFGFFNFYYANKILPGVYVQNLDLSGKSKKEAENLIKNTFSFTEKIILKSGPDNFEMDLSALEFDYDAEKTAMNAFLQNRSENPAVSVVKKIQSIYQRHSIPLIININDARLHEYIDVISGKIDTNPVFPSVTYSNDKVEVNPGKSGKKTDRNSLYSLILTKLASHDFSDTTIPVRVEQTEITSEESSLLAKRATKLIDKSLTISRDGEDFLIDTPKLLSFLESKSGYVESIVSEYVKNDLSPKINKEPQDAVFREKSGKVVEFLPGKKGVAINQEEVTNKIIETVSLLEESAEKNSTITITSQLTEPKVTTNEVNTLGIKELLGVGKSNFKGSIPGRIHNVNHASQILNGVLIAPNEIVSFNKILGDISQLTGYKQAYIIKDGKTILGDGGGVCQTSTTLFRAVLEAGLPVVERRAHAYRVGYYEQGFPPGLDATVFSPTTDFKFKNDTPGYLLLQTTVDLKNLALAYEIYGTSDGRVSHISKPITTSQIAPPEDLYIDDPNIPLGKTEQTEHKAWGAKVIFDYKVERNGETLFEKTFVSNYRPWGAVYLRGTKPL